MTWLRVLAVLPVAAFAMTLGADASQQTAAPPACEVTEPMAAPPVADWNGFPFPRGRWFANAEQTLWASIGWEAGPLESIGPGHSILWIRPPDAQLSVAGRRVDGEAPPMPLTIGAVFADRYVPSLVRFPTPGCWEVTAIAGASRLTFVVYVEALPPPSAPRTR